LYDLSRTPSTDPRFSNATEDIKQHREHWRDWDDDWVFYDVRFDLLHAPDNEFLAFLCETVHPVVRSDSSEADELVKAYNYHLEIDGWNLVESSQISGRPTFSAQRLAERLQLFDEPTGWRKVDRQIQEVRHRLNDADSEERYQAVGLICREVLITVAQAVYEPSRHPSKDDVRPSATDAKRMLEAIFAAELAGQANAEARSHAKAALSLALALQHKRTADFRLAALCAEATSSVVNLLAVLAGRRGRSF